MTSGQLRARLRSMREKKEVKVITAEEKARIEYYRNLSATQRIDYFDHARLIAAMSNAERQQRMAKQSRLGGSIFDWLW